MRLLTIAVGLVGMSACGGGTSGEALLSGSVTGSYDGSSYTVAYGIVAAKSGAYIIGLGSDPIDCGTLDATDPPVGDTAAISLATLTVGTYANTSVQLFHNISSFSGVGSNTGSLDVTSTSPTSLTGTIAYSDTITGKAYALNGSFEVVNCSP